MVRFGWVPWRYAVRFEPEMLELWKWKCDWPTVTGPHSRRISTTHGRRERETSFTRLYLEGRRN